MNRCYSSELIPFEPRYKKEVRRLGLRFSHICHELFLLSFESTDWWWFKTTAARFFSFKTDITLCNVSLNQVTSGENQLTSNDYQKFTEYLPILCHVQVVHVWLLFITLFIHSKKLHRVSSIPASSVVTFRIGLLLLLPILFLANTLILYVVQGKRPVREAVVERLETTHALLESDPWQTTSLKIWSSSLISTVYFSMALFPSKPAVQEIFTTREPFVSTVMFCGGSGTTRELKNISTNNKICNFTWKFIPLHRER